MRVFGILLMLFSLSALAVTDERVCIRDYSATPDQEINPCDIGAGRYFKIESLEDPDVIVCGLAYTDRNCKESPKEFDHVRDLNDEVRCVVNFHQPPIAMYCASTPDLYSWVRSAWD